MPRRISVTPVAGHTRAPLGIGIIAAPEPRAPATAPPHLHPGQLSHASRPRRQSGSAQRETVRYPSAPVSTASTPGIATAYAVSTRVTAAWAGDCGRKRRGRWAGRVSHPRRSGRAPKGSAHPSSKGSPDPHTWGFSLRTPLFAVATAPWCTIASTTMSAPKAMTTDGTEHCHDQMFRPNAYPRGARPG